MLYHALMLLLTVYIYALKILGKSPV
ncbi:hypothetical protein Gotri_018564 [Gossypium trilobum]|uniref:Uncharacterized protein n=1 Tax=Gossypium trilobum TaxID=34281 RepID=A0A7J9EA16_9ROSI|nr:hypothetical protein [Gossypium trilobum]